MSSHEIDICVYRKHGRSAGEKPHQCIWDKTLYKNDQQARELAEQCAVNPILSTRNGYKGVSFLHKALPYLSYIDAWIMPVAHALLYGVVKKFVDRLVVSCTIAVLSFKLPFIFISPLHRVRLLWTLAGENWANECTLLCPVMTLLRMSLQVRMTTSGLRPG